MTKNKIRIRACGGFGNKANTKAFEIQYSLSFGLVWYTLRGRELYFLPKDEALRQMEKLTLIDILEYRRKQKEAEKLRRQKCIEESTNDQIESMTITRPLRAPNPEGKE